MPYTPLDSSTISFDHSCNVIGMYLKKKHSNHWWNILSPHPAIHPTVYCGAISNLVSVWRRMIGVMYIWNIRYTGSGNTGCMAVLRGRYCHGFGPAVTSRNYTDRKDCVDSKAREDCTGSNFMWHLCSMDYFLQSASVGNNGVTSLAAVSHYWSVRAFACGRSGRSSSNFDRQSAWAVDRPPSVVHQPV